MFLPRLLLLLTCLLLLSVPNLCQDNEYNIKGYQETKAELDTNADWRYRMVRNVSWYKGNMNIRFNTSEHGAAASCEWKDGEIWRLSDGTFLKPYKQPQCIYDFHKIAIITHEYELFRYCVKGAFFRGHDYTDPKSIPSPDALLYMIEGTVICNKTRNEMVNERLLAIGFTVELICGDDKILSKFEDKGKYNGKFFLAASFSKKQGCPPLASEEHHHRFPVRIRLTHYCTDRGLREVMNFNVYIGKKQVPTSVHEDTKLVLDPVWGRLIRSTGQDLCAWDFKRVCTPNNP